MNLVVELFSVSKEHIAWVVCGQMKEEWAKVECGQSVQGAEGLDPTSSAGSY